MNLIVEELKTQKTNQAFLAKYVQFLIEYFKKTPHLSEDKTYLRIKKLSDKIYSYFPLIPSVRNISNKLIGNVKDKVDDKFQLENLQQNQVDLHNFIKKLNRKTSDGDGYTQSQKIKVQGERNIDEKVLRSILLNECDNIKLQFNQIDIFFKKYLTQKIISKSKIVFLDSFNSNRSVLENICKEKKALLKIISLNNESTLTQNEVPLKDAARQIRRANLVMISAASVTKNGGALVESGGLMIVTSALAFKVPVIILHQGYCLSDNLMQGQSSLLNVQNPQQYFDYQENSEMKVLIGKKYDYIEPKLISQLVNEYGCWCPENATQMFARYYE